MVSQVEVVLRMTLLGSGILAGSLTFFLNKELLAYSEYSNMRKHEVQIF